MWPGTCQAHEPCCHSGQRAWPSLPLPSPSFCHLPALPRGDGSPVLSHCTHRADSCSSNKTLLNLTGVHSDSGDVLRRPGTDCRSSSPTQAIFILMASWAISLAPLTSLMLTPPLPFPRFSGYLFFCCYPYQENNVTTLAYQPDIPSRLQRDSVQNSSPVFTHKHTLWTRRQWKEHRMHQGGCKTPRKTGRSPTEQAPVPTIPFFIWTSV